MRSVRPIRFVAASAAAMLAFFLADSPLPVHAQAPFPDKPAQKCGRAVIKEVGKYVKQAQKIVDKCKKSIITKGIGKNGELTLAECSVANQLVTPSPADSKLAQKRQKLLDGIAKKCGGGDKSCATTGDNIPLADYNWGIAMCPDIEGGGNCFNAINHCGDVGECLACLVDFVVEQAENDLLYDNFDAGAFTATIDPGKTRNKCQVAIAKSAGMFLLAKQKILQKCWDGKFKGKTDKFTAGVICPDADVASKSQDKIIKAESKKVKSICKACGGDDVTGAHPNFTCTVEPQGSGDPIFGDFINDVIGGSFACPAVTVPATDIHPLGLDCSTVDDGGATTDVDDLAEYLACVDCVLEFKADCISFAGVGDQGTLQLGPEYEYPADCGPGSGGGPTPTPTATPPPTVTPTPTPTPTATPTPVCGNGVVEAGEVCDGADDAACPSPGTGQCLPAAVVAGDPECICCFDPTPAMPDHRKTYRPVMGGISAINSVEASCLASAGFVSAGTLGAIVFSGGSPYVLANNHVFGRQSDFDPLTTDDPAAAGCLGGVLDAVPGEPVMQPAPLDGGAPGAADIGVLPAGLPDPYEPICAPGGFCPGGTGLFANTCNSTAACVDAAGENCIDAAIAALTVPAAIPAAGTEGILDVGLNSTFGAPIGPTTCKDADVDLSIVSRIVMKSGRTTGFTWGRISGVGDVIVSLATGTCSVASGNAGEPCLVDADCPVVAAGACVLTNTGRGVPLGAAALFVNQIFITAEGSATDFSLGGDSGSVVLTGTLEPVGLLFAGGAGTSIANPIKPVLARFGVTF